MIFYLGTHVLGHAKEFERTFISVNRIRNRRSDFVVKDWILDSGAFTEISKFGHYRSPVTEYAQQVNRWSTCGNLELAVTQDYMCEPFILAKTGLTVQQHQHLTIERYDTLLGLTQTPIMPVLQGYVPEDYVRHLALYGERLKQGQRVGVGSICKRNGNPQAIAAVLEAIKRERSDLQLHGFGLKTTALRNEYIVSLLYSADSMAWSYAARRQGRDRNGLAEAQRFVTEIELGSGSRKHQFTLAL